VAAYNDNVNYNSPAPYGGKCGSGGTAVDPNGTFDNCGTGVSTFTISKDGTCAKPWFKLSNAQFNSLTPQGNATRPNIIPFGMLPFDATDDTTDKYLIVNQGSNQGGSILTPGTGGIGIDLGPLATRHSTYDWYKTGYTFVPTPLYTPSVFLQYIKSRKTFRTISALDDSTFVSNGIYVWNGSMPLSVPGNTSFNGKNVVLYVPGDVSIGNLNPAGSVAIISSGTLSINSSATSIKGIYIAKSVHLDPSVQGLKVRGNISVVTDSANAGSGFSTARVNSNYQMPSLFMVFDPVMYINLLPYLSTDLYDYKQLQ
jgi:hypothetical protein